MKNKSWVELSESERAARLISAAPDLLAAVELAAKYLGDDGESDGWRIVDAPMPAGLSQSEREVLRALRAAIAKAQGGK